MKSKLLLILLAATLILSACGTQNTTEPPGTAVAPPVIHTSAGDFVYVSARFADEVHGETPEPGNNILLVVLARADGGEIDLEAFQEAQAGVYVLGDDGSLTYSPMAGWVDEEFVIGFRPPETAETFQLIWPENPPIEIDLSE